MLLDSAETLDDVVELLHCRLRDRLLCDVVRRVHDDECLVGNFDLAAMIRCRLSGAITGDPAAVNAPAALRPWGACTI